VIIVVGAGIAGAAVALAVAKAGYEVTVYEAHPDGGADIGAFLTLADNGMRALAALDVPVSAGFPLTNMSILSADGAEIATVPLAGYRCVRRAELGSLLRASAVRRGISVRHSARLATLEGNVAVFADGSTATGELVIAADGLRSVARSCVDPADTGPRYAGQHVFYGYTPVAPPAVPARITMIRGSSSAFGYCVSPGGETYWFARVPADSPWSGSGSSALVAAVERDGGPAASIVRATQDVLATSAWDLVPGGRWIADRVVLIGDAAHAASPVTGQGASMALEDAVVLGKALRDSAGVGAAVERYEMLRRPRVEHNIAVSAAATAGQRSAGRPEQRVSRVDDSIDALLDWDAGLPSL
jgi:2-polyprenyl-6-methoxyphenol hydroxylase-like FAD-dependent oxidoreductase